MVHLQVKEQEPLRSYEFAFDGKLTDGVLVAAERFELEEALQKALTTLKPPPYKLPRGGPKLLSSLLQSTAPLLPRDFPSHDVVLLETDDKNVPWELVFPESVVVRGATHQGAAAGQPQTAETRVAASLISPEVFPWCESEIAGLGKAARLDQGTDLLLNCPAGFAYLAAGTDSSGNLCLPEPLDLTRWLPRQLNQPRRLPSVLFLRLIEGHGETLLEVADALARGFLKLGVQAVLVNYWEPDPQNFPEALSRFSQTLKTEGLSAAFSALRESLSAEDPFLSRYAFGLYGRIDLEPDDIVPRSFGSKLAATTVAKLGKPDFRIRIVAGPDKGRVIPIYAQALQKGKRLVVGSPGLKRCQIEIQDKTLANEAVSIELEDETLYLTSLCSKPEAVRIEGLPVYKKVPLRKSLTVESGKTRFVLELGTSEDSTEEEGVEKNRYHLILSSGPKEDKYLDHPLNAVSTMIGREGSFPLHDPSVSRQHMLIVERDGAHHVCTLGQAKVVLNGVPVEREAPLKHSDLLQLSDNTTLQYVDSRRL